MFCFLLLILSCGSVSIRSSSSNPDLFDTIDQDVDRFFVFDHNIVGGIENISIDDNVSNDQLINSTSFLFSNYSTIVSSLRVASDGNLQFGNQNVERNGDLFLLEIDNNQFFVEFKKTNDGNFKILLSAGGVKISGSFIFELSSDDSSSSVVTNEDILSTRSNNFDNIISQSAVGFDAAKNFFNFNSSDNAGIFAFIINVFISLVDGGIVSGVVLAPDGNQINLVQISNVTENNISFSKFSIVALGQTLGEINIIERINSDNSRRYDQCSILLHDNNVFVENINPIEDSLIDDISTLANEDGKYRFIFGSVERLISQAEQGGATG